MLQFRREPVDLQIIPLELGYAFLVFNDEHAFHARLRA